LTESLIIAMIDNISIFNLFSHQSEIYLNYRNEMCYIILNDELYEIKNKNIQVIKIFDSINYSLFRSSLWINFLVALKIIRKGFIIRKLLKD